MEYLEGETLTAFMKREKKIPEEQAVDIVVPILQTLEDVHRHGIIHRDIAPDNIFLAKGQDGKTHVKLIDFGASRYASTSHSKSLTVLIKPGYSPAEQYQSNGEQGRSRMFTRWARSYINWSQGSDRRMPLSAAPKCKAAARTR